jgi:class 3 adenylate cyclase
MNLRLESQHPISFPPAVCWPVLCKTDWLNRSLGLPPVDYVIESRKEGGSEVHARTRLLGREWRWRELPFEWREPEFFRVRRIFDSGPFKELRMQMTFDPGPADSTRLMIISEFNCRNSLGRWLARRVLGPKAERDLRRVTSHLAEFLQGRKKVVLPNLPVQPVNEAPLRIGLEKLRKAGQSPQLVLRLEQFLREAPDVELSHVRPLAVARKWGEDPWKVLELFLNTPSSGLLDLRWEILCPNCRSTREPAVKSLRDLKRTSHCEVCQIKFDAEFDKSVELKFAVNPGVRPLENQVFCLAGPGGKPHVVSQLALTPGEERSWKLPELSDSVRLRSPQVGQFAVLDPQDLAGRSQSLSILCDPSGFRITRQLVGSEPFEARFQNPNPFAVLVSFERVNWDPDILTAARVTNWQPFRDLFAREVISPTEQVTVGSQVVLFTDLRGSTALYHSLGDAVAYALVRNHFAVLFEAVHTHHGTIVKTIGDAVMAAFSRVDEALAAVREMHEKLPAGNPALQNPLVLKSSLHVGPCLAVNANDSLDFFGTTINLAARMVECCRGGDLTVSDELFQRPEMATFSAQCASKPEAAEVQFRGFEQPHRVWRIKMV